MLTYLVKSLTGEEREKTEETQGVKINWLHLVWIQARILFHDLIGNYIISNGNPSLLGESIPLDEKSPRFNHIKCCLPIKKPLYYYLEQMLFSYR